MSDPVPTAGEAQAPSKDKKNTNIVTKPEQPKPVALSDRDMLFNIGKSATENRTTRRPGLQKEGTKVFGVPKPGKKKKFMDVSRHYVADQADKIAEGSASTRFAKHSVPQLPRPRESTLKLDQRAKRASDMRTRGFKPAKSQNVSTNSVPGEDHLSTHGASSSALESTFAFAASTTSSSDPVNPTVEKNNSAHATDLRTEDASIPESRIPATPTIPAIKKNPPTTNRAKRQFAPSADSNLSRRVPKTPDVAHQNGSDSAEPRRSNRRIQPTSRVTTGTVLKLALNLYCLYSCTTVSH